MEMLIRVQAIIRGYLQRRKYRIQKVASDMASKYFKAEEALETLTGNFKRDAALKQKIYTYKSGAVYNGQWKGGLRHG